MANKFCKAGGVRCERFRPMGSVEFRCDGVVDGLISAMGGQNIKGFEQCPWPSKQKVVVDRFEKVWDYFALGSSSVNPYTGAVIINKKALISALKEAGFTDE